jgi:hypothetical protein
LEYGKGLLLTRGGEEEHQMRKRRLHLYWVGAVAAGLFVVVVAHEVGKSFGERAQRTYETSQKAE